MKYRMISDYVYFSPFRRAAKIDTYANPVDSDEKAIHEPSHQDYTVYHPFFDFKLKPHFTSMAMFSFKDRTV